VTEEIEQHDDPISSGLALEHSLQTRKRPDGNPHGCTGPEGPTRAQSVQPGFWLFPRAQLSNYPIGNDGKTGAEANDMGNPGSRMNGTEGLASLIESQEQIAREQRDDCFAPARPPPQWLQESREVNLVALPLQIRLSNVFQERLRTNEVPTQHSPAGGLCVQ
jgi:hypothetical protein